MAGAGYKLFNTGDVLTAAQVNTYLQEQVVMVFANATARTAALSGVLAEGMVSYLQDTNAVEVYDGSAWVGIASGDITAVTAGTGISGGGTSGAVTITNSMATEITAAGDIIVGTGSGTFDNLPIGTTGQVLTADTTVSPYKVKWAAAGGGSSSFSGCLIYPSASRTNYLAANTETAITFDSEWFDTDGYHSTSTNTSRITVPSGKAGYFAISGCAMTTTNSNANSVGIFKNGTRIFSHDYTGNGGNEAVFVNGIANLAVGDYVELRYYSGTSAKTLYGYNDTADYTTNLFVQYLGA